MTQANLIFSAPESHARKERGMDLAALHRKALLDRVRFGMESLALGRPDRCCTADDAQMFLVKEGYPESALGNAAGSIFRGEKWQWTGRWTQSDRVVAHQNNLRVWRLK